MYYTVLLFIIYFTIIMYYPTLDLTLTLTLAIPYLTRDLAISPHGAEV